MAAAAQTSGPTTEPDPSRSAPDMPSRLCRVLKVVRRLIDYGKQLAGTLQQRAASPGFVPFARPFGTTDLAAILARITAGLRRAALLEGRLSQRAARGRELTVPPTRVRTKRPARQVASSEAETKPRTARNPRLAYLPSEQEIADQVRRRPVGVVIADICRDLGIRPGDLDREFWDEVSMAVMVYGGSLSVFLDKPSWLPLGYGLIDPLAPLWPPPPPRVPATGPP